jgi:hypothetical protein
MDDDLRCERYAASSGYQLLSSTVRQLYCTSLLRDLAAIRGDFSLLMMLITASQLSIELLHFCFRVSTAVTGK